MLVFDHVLIAVSDLDEAATRFRSDLGLASLEGGRHSGFGTGNRIVPLGRDYIELIGVVDPMEVSALADWVAALSRDRDRPAAVCLRTDDIEAVAGRLELQVMAMERSRPDGEVLRWKLAGLIETLADPALPFFIQWLTDEGQHPGAAAIRHDVEVTGIAWVEIAGDAAAIHHRVGTTANAPDIRVVEGEPGVRAVALATKTDPLVIS